MQLGASGSDTLFIQGLSGWQRAYTPATLPVPCMDTRQKQT